LHAAGCHVEVTTLIVPGHNDGEADISAIASYLASISPDIPLHVTRFFPRFHLTEIGPTPVATVRHLADIAKRYLKRVQVGNC
jgi:pyruvate formate lyase activating enzyme